MYFSVRWPNEGLRKHRLMSLALRFFFQQFLQMRFLLPGTVLNAIGRMVMMGFEEVNLYIVPLVPGQAGFVVFQLLIQFMAYGLKLIGSQVFQIGIGQHALQFGLWFLRNGSRLNQTGDEVDFCFRIAKIRKFFGRQRDAFFFMSLTQVYEAGIMKECCGFDELDVFFAQAFLSGNELRHFNYMQGMFPMMIGEVGRKLFFEAIQYIGIEFIPVLHRLMFFPVRQNAPAGFFDVLYVHKRSGIQFADAVFYAQQLETGHNGDHNITVGLYIKTFR